MSETLKTGLENYPQAYGKGLEGSLDNVQRGVGVLPAPYNSPRIILASFGLQYLKPRFYKPGAEPFAGIDSGATFDNLDEVDPTNGVSRFNTPIFINMALVDPADPFNRLQLDTVLIELFRAKTIIKTSINGRDGTVKEYISNGDWELIIRGLVADNSPQKYPQEQVATMLDLLNKNEALKVSSHYLNDIYKIDSIVVDSFSFPQRPGFLNTQLFEIRASSDTPIELAPKTF